MTYIVDFIIGLIVVSIIILIIVLIADCLGIIEDTLYKKTIKLINKYNVLSELITAYHETFDDYDKAFHNFFKTKDKLEKLREKLPYSTSKEKIEIEEQIEKLKEKKEILEIAFEYSKKQKDISFEKTKIYAKEHLSKREIRLFNKGYWI